MRDGAANWLPRIAYAGVQHYLPRNGYGKAAILVMKKSLRIMALSTLGLMQVAAPGGAQGLAGNYLAARHASMFSDYAEAAMYYTRLLAVDPTNPALLESAMMAYVALGKIDTALPIARQTQSRGIDSQVANMVLVADQFKRGAFEQALADIEAGRAIGPLVDGLLKAWAQVGLGKMAEALDAFDAVTASPGLEAFGASHKALALATVGDFEGADRIFSGDESGPLPATRHGVIAHAQILSQLERNQDAIDLIQAIFGTDLDPEIAEVRAALVAGKMLPFTAVGSATEGAAEVFYGVAGAVNGDAAEAYTLIYSRMAEYLRATNVDAILLSAALLDSMERYDLATEAYNSVPRDSSAFHAAELGRAEALRKSGKVDAAIEVLTQLAKSKPDLAIVQITLGDTLRGLERYEEAVAAYNAAIDILGPAEEGQWFVYYTRGIALERLKRWDEAETDFRLALKLNPDQPQVLNYLGYSFVEQGTNLEEALGMIERAVSARPDDGYITDSLGWVLFRMGRYTEAVAHMERAAELMAVDPVVNDHLGDVYWAVGRSLEAQFQWRRALSFDPEEKDAIRIRRKLEVGLNEVLKEEGEEPIKVTANDG